MEDDIVVRGFSDSQLVVRVQDPGVVVGLSESVSYVRKDGKEVFVRSVDTNITVSVD